MNTVFAIGDSWFNYFFTDLYQVLRDRGFAVERVAWPGDTLQSIASRTLTHPVPGTPPQLDLLSSLIRASTAPPSAIVLSAGGDDVVALEGGQSRLVHLLRPADGGGPPLYDNELRVLVDGELERDLTTVLVAITEMCRAQFAEATPILIHGYDYPVPDGRRGPFNRGPWLGPAFRLKGYGVDRMDERRTAMVGLIDQLNNMQRRLVKEDRFSHVTHVDLRDLLPRDEANYRKYWENELHPTRLGFRMVGKRFADELRKLA